MFKADDLPRVPIDDWIQFGVEWTALHLRPVFLLIKWPVETVLRLHRQHAAVRAVSHLRRAVRAARLAARLARHRGVQRVLAHRDRLHGPVEARHHHALADHHRDRVLRADRRADRHSVRAQQHHLARRAADPRHHADHAVLRLSRAGGDVLRRRHRAGRDRRGDGRRARADPLHQSRHPAGRQGNHRGRARLRGDRAAIAVGDPAPARAADHFGAA